MLVTNLLGAVGLGAASGLNAWIPLLGLGIAQRTGVVTLTEPFDALGSNAALGILAVVFVVDLVGDKIAVVDHVLHAVGSLVAPVSGAVVLAAQENLLSNASPWLAAVLGVVLAETVHLGRSSLRPVVTAGTAGVGNPVVSTAEDLGSAVLTVLAVLVPVLAFAVAVGAAAYGVHRWRRWRRARAARRPAVHP